MVIAAATSASVGLATRTTWVPVTLAVTGRIAGLLENARYGAVPPEIVSVAGVPG